MLQEIVASTSSDLDSLINYPNNTEITSKKGLSDCLEKQRSV